MKKTTVTHRCAKPCWVLAILLAGCSQDPGTQAIRSSHKPTNVSNINQAGNADPRAFAPGETVCYMVAEGTVLADGSQGALGTRVYRYEPWIVDGDVDYGRDGVTRALHDRAFSQPPRELTAVLGSPEMLYLVDDESERLLRFDGGSAWMDVPPARDVERFDQIFAVRFAGSSIYVLGRASSKIRLDQVDAPRGPSPKYDVLGAAIAGVTAGEFIATPEQRAFASSQPATDEKPAAMTLHRFSSEGYEQESFARVSNLVGTVDNTYFVAAASEAGTDVLHHWPIGESPGALGVEIPRHLTPVGNALFVAGDDSGNRKLVKVTDAARDVAWPGGNVIEQVHGIAEWSDNVWIVGSTTSKTLVMHSMDDGSLRVKHELTQLNNANDALDPRALVGLEHALSMSSGQHRCWNISVNSASYGDPDNVQAFTIGETTTMLGMVLFNGTDSTNGRELFRWWSHD